MGSPGANPAGSDDLRLIVDCRTKTLRRHPIGCEELRRHKIEDPGSGRIDPWPVIGFTNDLPPVIEATLDDATRHFPAGDAEILYAAGRGIEEGVGVACDAARARHLPAIVDVTREERDAQAAQISHLAILIEKGVADSARSGGMAYRNIPREVVRSGSVWDLAIFPAHGFRESAKWRVSCELGPSTALDMKKPRIAARLLQKVAAIHARSELQLFL